MPVEKLDGASVAMYISYLYLSAHYYIMFGTNQTRIMWNDRPRPDFSEARAAPDERKRRAALLHAFLCVTRWQATHSQRDEIAAHMRTEMLEAHLPHGPSWQSLLSREADRMARFIVAVATKDPVAMGWNVNILQLAHVADNCLTKTGEMFWFLHAVSAFDLRAALRASDTSGAWGQKRARLYQCYLGDPEPVPPKIEFTAFAKHFFPSMFDDDQALPGILARVNADALQSNARNHSTALAELIG